VSMDAWTIVLVALSVTFLAILIAVVLFMGYLRLILTIASFMGPNTRLVAIGARFTRREEVERLLELGSLSEILSEIRTSGYDLKDVEGMGLEAMETEIERKMVEIISTAFSSLPEAVRPFADAYMLRFDNRVATRVIKAKYAGERPYDIEKKVYPVRFITPEVLRQMVDAATVEEALAVLDATPFGDVPLKTWSATENLVSVDTAMDKVVLEKLMESVRLVDETVKPAVSAFVGMMIDVHNVTSMLRAKNMEIENVEELLVEGGYEVPLWKLKQMMEARSIEEAIAQLEGTSYYQEIRDLRTVKDVERALERYMLKRAEEIARTYYSSAGPTVWFPLAKEYEARNIRALLLGVMKNVRKEFVRDALVVVE